MKKRINKKSICLFLSVFLLGNCLTQLPAKNANAVTNSGTITESTTEWTNKDVTISYGFTTTSRKGLASVTDPSNTYNYNFGWSRGTHQEARTGTRVVSTPCKVFTGASTAPFSSNWASTHPGDTTAYITYTSSYWPFTDVYPPCYVSYYMSYTETTEPYTYYVTVDNSDITVSSTTLSVNKSFIIGGNGDYTVTAKVYNDDLTTSSTSVADTVTKTITVSNIDKIAPTMTLTPNITSLTNGNVNISYQSSNGGSGSPINLVTKPDGSSLTGNWSSYSNFYAVTQNGTYTFSTKDQAGNLTSKSITVSNIDKTVPVIDLTQTLAESKIDSTINYSVTETNFNNIVLPDGTMSTSKTGTFKASSNGTYSFKVTDKAGNVTTQTIDVTEISSVQCSLSSNEVEFVTTEILGSPEPTVGNLDYSITSSAPYIVKTKAVTSFVNVDDPTLMIPITALGIKVNGGETHNYTGLADTITLATGTGSVDPSVYNLNFVVNPSEFYGLRSGVYKSVVQIIAEQN